MKNSPKVNVCCVIPEEHLHGPLYFEGNATGDVYLEMLQNSGKLT